jgi:predicted aspartyl protease
MFPPASHARPRRSSVSSLLAAAAVALLGAACAVEVEPETAEDPDAFDEGVPEAPEPAEGEGIPLEVREGPFDGALLLVPVMIDDQGPFSFVLDTGATNTTIDATLADELGLPETGDEGEVTGVTGEDIGTGVEISSWELGDVALEERTVIALDLGEGEDGLGVDGLIGGDVLAAFGTLTLDYEGGTLVVGD